MRSSLFLHFRIVKHRALLGAWVMPRRLFPSAAECFAPSARAMLTQSMDIEAEFMKEALSEARGAAAAGEVPIGAIIVHDGRVVARSGNRTIRDCDPTAHAEMVVLREAARGLGNYRLADSVVYSTIEPCAMCAGALIQARVRLLVYGATDEKAGAVESHFQICDSDHLNHRVEVIKGVLEAECLYLIS